MTGTALHDDTLRDAIGGDPDSHHDTPCSRRRRAVLGYTGKVVVSMTGARLRNRRCGNGQR